MNKFKMELDQYEEYDIHIDPIIWNNKKFEALNKRGSILGYTPITTTKNLAQHLAARLIHYKSGEKITPFGFIKTYDKDGKLIHPKYNDFDNEFPGWCEGIELHIVDYSNVWTVNEINEQQNI